MAGSGIAGNNGVGHDIQGAGAAQVAGDFHVAVKSGSGGGSADMEDILGE